MFRLTNGWLTLFGFCYSSPWIVTWPLGFSQSIFRNKAQCWWYVALFPFGFVPCFLLPWRHAVVKNNSKTIFLTIFLTFNFHVLFFTFFFIFYFLLYIGRRSKWISSFRRRWSNTTKENDICSVIKYIFSNCPSLSISRLIVNFSLNCLIIVSLNVFIGKLTMRISHNISGEKMFQKKKAT